MRNELENIERIERYLEGEMDTDEHQAFEAEMSNDPELKNNVELQKQLQEGIKRQALKAEIQAAHQRFIKGGGAGGNFFTSAKFFALLAGIIAIVTITIWLSPRSKSPSPVGDWPGMGANSTISDTFNAAIPSQFFTFNPKEDQVITGKDGIRVYIPKGAFLDENGKEVKHEVELELKEALGSDDMIMGNLTTLDADSNILESDGMLYLDAKSKGKKLTVNPEKPLYIEVPTKERKPGMMIYKGHRGNNGNMIWSAPKKPENFLVTVPFENLNFYPPGFEDAVEAGMPFKGHKESSLELKDSLYYSLKMPTSFANEMRESDTNARTNEVQLQTKDSDLSLNEAYYRGNIVKDGRYTNEAFENGTNVMGRYLMTTKQVDNDNIELSITINVADGEFVAYPQMPSATDGSTIRSEQTLIILNGVERVGELIRPPAIKEFIEAAGKALPGYNKTFTVKQLFKGTTQTQQIGYLIRPAIAQEGEWTQPNLVRGDFTLPALQNQTDSTSVEVAAKPCQCINPRTIQTIRQEKYQNSFLATKEFEKRLQAIFDNCRQDILELYITNLEKDLWEVDELASKLCDNATGPNSDRSYNAFQKFADQKLTNVKGAELYADMLKKAYADDMKRYEEEIKEAHKAYQKELKKEDAKVEKVKAQYRKVLVKREAKRMKSYGFTWGETGWANVDRGTIPKKVAKRIDVKIKLDKKATRSYAYFSFRGIKSLYRLNYDQQGDQYYPGYASTHSMDMPASGGFSVISVSYFGDSLFIDTTFRTTDFGGVITLNPKYVKADDAKKLFNSLSGSGSSNNIEKDLGFQQKFYEEKLRREKHRKENAFIQSLREVAFPCCFREKPRSTSQVNGSRLFGSECSSCHLLGRDMTGPNLVDVEERWKKSTVNLNDYLKNPTQYYKGNDPYINSLNNHWVPRSGLKRAINLTDKEIEDILSYIQLIGTAMKLSKSTAVNSVEWGITVVNANGTEELVLKSKEPERFKKLLEQEHKNANKKDQWGPRSRKPEEDQQ